MDMEEAEPVEVKSSRHHWSTGSGVSGVLPFSSRGHTNGVWHNAYKVLFAFFSSCE
jgi:hypothetical protein